MREKEHLHDRYQTKANKMDGAEFDKNAEKALEYEKTKDEREVGKTLAYNLYRKPANILNKAFTDDKPFFTPAKTALAGLVALVVLARSFGAIVGVSLMYKAAKNKFYDGSKLQEQINEKYYNKPPEKFDSQQLEQITVKGLSQDVKNQYQTFDSQGQHQGAAQGLVQEQQRGGRWRGKEGCST